MENLYRLIDLNDVCLKDSFPLVYIDLIVDSKTQDIELHGCLFHVQLDLLKSNRRRERSTLIKGCIITKLCPSS